MQEGYFSLWRLSLWRTHPKLHSPDQAVIKSPKQNEVLFVCGAGDQRVWSPAPSEHRICESPVSNSPTDVENSADHFGAFTMISSIPNDSSLSGTYFWIRPMERLLFLFWVLACCREKWGTEVCKHLSAHPGAFFWLMPAEIWESLKSVTFWASLGACPGRTTHNIRASFSISHLIMIFLDLTPFIVCSLQAVYVQFHTRAVCLMCVFL